MEVGELCDRLSENEADEYEAEKEYQSDLKVGYMNTYVV